jgi:hypothetical protein
MSYPDALMYYANTLRGVSTNVFRVNAMTTGDVGSSQTIRFELPSNTLLNLRQTRLQFNAKCVGSAGDGNNQRLPPLHLLVNRVSVLAGGIPIDSGCNNLPVITEVLRQMRPDDCDPVDEHDAIYRQVSNSTYMDLSGSLEVGINTDGAGQFNMSLGTFFDSVSPSILATDILPSLQVEIFLSNNSVVLNPISSVSNPLFANEIIAGDQPTTLGATSTGSPDFQITNYHLVCPCVAIGDKGYEMMIDSAISRGKYVPVLYHQYYNFSSTYTGDFIGSNGSECLNKLIAVFRKNGYDAVGLAPWIRAGYTNEDGAITKRGDAQATYQVLQDGLYPTSEEYVHPQLLFEAPLTTALVSNANNTTNQVSSLPRLNWRVSNVMMPNYQVPLIEWYRLTKQAMDCSKPTKAKSQFEFMSTSFVVAQALNLPNTSVRLKCGADMRGSTSQIRLESNNTTNMKTNDNIEVFFQCTSELRIGEGMQLQVFN